MIFKGNNIHFSARETPGEKFPQICSLKKLRSSVVSGKPKSDYKYLYSSGIINGNDFKGNNVHFGAQETPGEKFPQLQLEKARLLCCFRQAKQ